jgi:hypothetical protein
MGTTWLGQLVWCRACTSALEHASEKQDASQSASSVHSESAGASADVNTRYSREANVVLAEAILAYRAIESCIG